MDRRVLKLKLTKLSLSFAVLLGVGAEVFSKPGTIAEPIRYIGLPKIIDQSYHDSQLAPVVGVHSCQVLRANRTHPPESDGAGNAYNHAPMLAYWNGHYYLEYLAHEWNEHGNPTQTYLTRSVDGKRWEPPKLAFPGIVYNPMPLTFLRYPLALIHGSDGIVFDEMLVVESQVPPVRFNGRFKDRGLQYVRGIAEGNGNPPGTSMPLVYSMNKEDIWISHVPVPIRSVVEKPIRDTFDNEDALDSWNLYCPQWAPVSLAEDPGRGGVLKLSDKDPYDYARAVRVFPYSQETTISFKLNIKNTELNRLEIDVLDRNGNQAVFLVFDSAFRLFWANDGHVPQRFGQFKEATWYDLELRINAQAGQYDLVRDGETLIDGGKLYQPVDLVERIEFRTGAYRRENGFDHTHAILGSPVYTDVDEPRPESVYLIDDLIVD